MKKLLKTTMEKDIHPLYFEKVLCELILRSIMKMTAKKYNEKLTKNIQQSYEKNYQIV